MRKQDIDEGGEHLKEQIPCKLLLIIRAYDTIVSRNMTRGVGEIVMMEKIKELQKSMREKLDRIKNSEEISSEMKNDPLFTKTCECFDVLCEITKKNENKKK